MEITESTLGFLLYSLYFIFGYIAGLVIFAGLGMIVVRTAAKLLGLGEVPMLRAFIVALVINFVCSVINFSIGFNYGLSMSLFSQMSERPGELRDFTRMSGHLFSPTFLLWSTALGLTISAALFQCMLAKPDETTRLRFGECFALASLYYAVTFVALALLLFLVYVLIVFTFAMVDSPATGY